MATARFLVVGAGMFGVTAALELRRRGHAVELLDPAPLPRPRTEASSVDRSRAVRMDYGDDVFYADLAEAALQRWRGDWNERFGERVYEETGFLFLAATSLDGDGYEARSWRLLRARRQTLERLTRTTLAERFPAFAATALVDGYFQPNAGVTRAGRVVELLLREAEGAGIVLRGGASVARLVSRSGRVVGLVTADGRQREADAVLVTAGAWTSGVLPQLHGTLHPSAQTLLYFRPADPAPFRAPQLPTWAFDIANAGWYGFPATADGLVKVAHHGQGRAQPVEDRSPDPDLEGRARTFLARALPGLAGAPLHETKVCFYCDTPDGDFWIDADPERPGLFVAAGGSGHAFKFAPLLGDLIANAVEGRHDPRLDRFRWRQRRGNGDQARSQKD
jgi:sarcosine oxidase/L-pipecolate oxidase